VAGRFLQTVAIRSEGSLFFFQPKIGQKTGGHKQNVFLLSNFRNSPQNDFGENIANGDAKKALEKLYSAVLQHKAGYAQTI
jgi:hypothetical protein